MKIFLLISLCLSLAVCGKKAISPAQTNYADSVLVAAYIDVPAQISVSLKLPTKDLDSYHIGQRLMGLPYNTDPERFGNVFIADTKQGIYPIVIKSFSSH